MSKNKLFKIGRKSRAAIGTALSLCALAWPAAISARADDTAPTTAPSDMTASDDLAIPTIALGPSKAKQKHFDQRITKANILAPDIADVIPLGTNDLLLTAKKSGSTQLIVWDESGHTQIFNIEIATPVVMLQKKLQALFPNSTIKAEDVNGTVTLTGQVHDL